MSAFHLDTDFLVLALSRRGAEWNRLVELAGSEARLGMSALAWYAFSRGPRTAAQLARAEVFLGPEGVIPLSREPSTLAGDVYRALGSPRRRANDIVIGMTAAAMGSTLLTCTVRDFTGIPALQLEGVG